MSAGGTLTGRSFVSERPRNWLLALVASSFLVYAAAALIVHHQQNSDFIPERSSIAAAVSHVVYGANLGNVYSGVIDRFLDMKRPLREILAQAEQKEIPPGALLSTIWDGNGIGYILVTSAGFRLFGVSAFSATLVMLLLMGISAFAFVWRFPDRRAVVVILYFTTLTAVFFTSLVWAPHNAVQFAIGGIRYFSFLSILPAYHILLELFDNRGAGHRIHLQEFVPLAIQALILAVAVLVRNSALPILAAILVGALLVAWKNRGDRVAQTKILRKGAAAAVVGALFVGLMMLMATDYVKAGRFNGVVWHRIFVSLGLSPTFPFGNMREIYDCRRFIPEGLVNGPEDRNGHCILWDYAIKHNIPTDVVPTLTYGAVYEKATREAVFNIAWLYPVETFKVFFGTKMAYIPWSIGASFPMKFDGTRPVLICLFVAAIGIFLIFSLISSTIPSSRLSSNDGSAVVSATALLAVFSIPPLLAVWAMPHTSADLLFYCFFGGGLVAVAVLEKARRLMSFA